MSSSLDARFFNNHYSIYLQQGGSYWYIADNVIVGDTPVSTESLDGEGIELNGYSVESFGHVVAHNSISNVADGISNGTYNIDAYGNDIFDVSDDGFEGDPGGPNIRVWGNRIHNAAHNGISFQPQNSSPWYILRNQLVGFKEAPFKFRTTDRSVIRLVHDRDAGQDDLLQRLSPAAIHRQEQPWISVAGGEIWTSNQRERLADPFRLRRLRLGRSTATFRYSVVVYSSVLGFLRRVGLETRGRRIDRNRCSRPSTCRSRR